MADSKADNESNKPPLAVVETIYESNSRDVVATLERVLQGIKTGGYGQVVEVALVLKAEKVEVFGMGPSQDGATTALLLATAHLKMVQAVLAGDDS